MIVKHDADRINYINIGLMGLSALLAFKFPFQSFLLAYTVLGPLHYLTEISWLYDRNYYTKGKYDYLFLVALGVAVTLLFLGLFPGAPKGMSVALTLLAFLAAPIFAFLGGTIPRVVALVTAAFATFIFMPSYFCREIFGIFLPTLIHVFIFTGIFVLAGAVRGRSLSGIMSLVVFLGLACGFIFIHPVSAEPVSAYIRDSYGYIREDGTAAGSFIAVNLSLVQDLHLHQFEMPGASMATFVGGINDFLYQHPTGRSLMAFIAFAYIYHYLNWFSKTSVIRWHLIPRRRLIGILLIWAASVGIYAYDYLLGLKWLFFLSFAHVLLEFPLNHLTVAQIGKELKGMVMGKVS